MNSAIAVFLDSDFSFRLDSVRRYRRKTRWLAGIDNAKRKVPFALCVLPLSSEECKEACDYQEKRHHSGDDKQQEFAEEVWFHQLLSTHEPPPICTLIFPQGAKTRSSNALNSRFAGLANIKQKLTKCEHREDASPVMPAQQRPPISHQRIYGP
jgi:hypothetical protein